MSTVLTLGSLGLIVYCIAMDYAALPGHPAMHYALFVFSLVLLAYLEGLQVAILALEHVAPSTIPVACARARASHALATAQRGLNVQRFLVGRQFFVVFVVFLSAQLTTYPGLPKDSLPQWLYVSVINTGLPGALVVLAFGQLMPQLIAATHPVTVMNLVGAKQVIMLALGFEFVGVTHFSWLLTMIVKSCCGLDKRRTNSVGDDLAKQTIQQHQETIQQKEVNRDSANPNDSGSQEVLGSSSSPSSSSPMAISLAQAAAAAASSSSSSSSSSPVDEEDSSLLSSWHNVRSQIDLDASTLDADQLYQYAEKGLEASKTSDIRSKEVVAWLQTQSMSGERNLMSLYEYRERRYSSTESKSNPTSASSAMTTTANDGATEASSAAYSNSPSVEKSPFAFPSPADITRHLIQSGKGVPRYLLPPHHDKHIPPHIVAYDLVRRQDITTDRLERYSRANVERAQAMRVLRAVHASVERGRFPSLDDLVQGMVESGDIELTATEEAVVAAGAAGADDQPSAQPQGQ